MTNLVDVLRRRFMHVVLWQGLFVLSVLWGHLAVYLNTVELMRRIHFALMNSRDTFYITAAGGFETIQEEHLEMAKLAGQTLLNRSPDGLDSPERVDRLFNAKCEEQVKTDIAADADTFKMQGLHQKLEVGHVREVQLSPSTAVVEVSGQLIRTGFITHSDQTRQVVVDIQMVANDEFETNHKFPIVVYAYQVKFL
jgi:hypothetical protein